MIFGNSINARPADPKEGEQFHDLSTGKTYVAINGGVWMGPGDPTKHPEGVTVTSTTPAPKKRRAKK